MSTEKLISPSEVDSYLQCRRKHHYAHVERLQPKTFSDGLSTGIIGHAILQRYYEFIKAEQILDPLSGMRLAIHEITNELVTPQNIEYFHTLKPILEAYAIRYGTDTRYKILAVEQSFEYEGIAFTPDLIIQDTTTGKIYLEDHKFLSVFYTDKTIGLFPQMPRYIGLLRLSGRKVDGYIYNMIRTRAAKTAAPADRFRRATFNPKESTIQQVMEEFFRTVEEIRSGTYPTRTANSFNCGAYCSFANLCTADLNDEPGRELMVRAFFEPNTYGYYREVSDE